MGTIKDDPPPLDGIDADTIAEWLDNPCTKVVYGLLVEAQKEVERRIVEVALSHDGRTDFDVVKPVRSLGSVLQTIAMHRRIYDDAGVKHE